MYIFFLFDSILVIFMDNDLIARYIPTAIVTIISTVLVIKFNAKKSVKSEEKEIRKNCFIVPIIVEIIIMLYGFYSVASNVEKAREELETSMKIYEIWYGKAETDKMINEAIEKAIGTANQMWIITSVVYLAVAECVTVVTTKKLNKWLKEDFQFNNMEAFDQNEFQSSEYLGINEGNNTFENSDAPNNINWDL